jgi:exopolyphosphatase/guanosine-5'-triphosphate,3'-diphosphate pyrophosphatase
MGVLQGVAANQRSLCIDIGGGSTEVVVAQGERPSALWSVALGSVRLADVFEAHTKVPAERLALMRQYAAEEMEQALPPDLPGDPRSALGSSGTIQAVVAYASDGGTVATAREIRKAVDRLAKMGPKQRRELFDARRADIVVAGAVVLEAIVRHFRLDEVVAVDRGLRDGLLVDLLKGGTGEEGSLADAAVAIGRRFDFDEKHAKQVARLACNMFDTLADVHRLPRNARSFLEVAALLHDIGHAVSYQRHHKHTYYLIQNADIPGLADRERELVARIARYHRRSIPDLTHPGMEGLSAAEAQMVRRLATLLRLADSLDRSHRQPIEGIRATKSGDRISLLLRSRAPVDLELWDAANDAPLFRRVFGRKLAFRSARG